MNPSIFKKQPWEERQLEFDTSNSLVTGDSVKTVDSVTVLLGDQSQPSMVNGNSNIVGNKVYQKILGGINGVDYTIRVRVVTNNGDKIEDEITMQVRDT
jgi:hypothetical protein